MKKIVVSPDSFKGTMSSLTVAKIIKEELQEAFPFCEIVIMPVADGGEGSLDIIASTLKCDFVETIVEGADQSKRKARYAISDNSIAIIELAEACGITTQEELHPLTSNTYGFGELIKDALDRDIREFILCIGGSASTDAGCGMAMALGLKFLDDNGNQIRVCGETLKDIKEIDITNTHKGLKDSKFVVMCDVKNHLYGEDGAAYVYGPQKGANDSQVKILDEGLRHFNDLIFKKDDIDLNTYEGSGAAGGLGAGCIYFLNAKLESGIEAILKLNNFKEEIKDADLIITGEGKFDSQSLEGKVISGIINESSKKKIVVICGINEQKENKDSIKIYSMADEVSKEESLNNPENSLRIITQKLIKEIK